MIIDIIANTPTKIWILAAFLFWMGYQACFTRIRKVSRLFIIPAIFVWLEVSNLRELFGITKDHVFWSFIGFASGILLGVMITFRMVVVADRGRRLVQLPGDRITFAIIILNFSYQYILHVFAHVSPSTVNDFTVVCLLAMGFFSGLSVGRNMTFFSKYLNNESVHLV